MSRSALGDAAGVTRFLREARAAERLRGEHVARLYEVGHLGSGVPFLVMEHLEGRDLHAELERRGKLAVGDALTIVLQVCEALAEAHAAGMVHRDLKPSNIFLAKRSRGGVTVKVLDFGVAKVPPDASGAFEGENTGVTGTGVLLGSPQYMSPEQMQSSRDVDARADVWSLGVIAYQLVTGRLPFEGDGLAQIATAVLEGSPAPPGTLVKGLPPALDAAILACLEADRDRRCAGVVELAASLAPFAPRTAAPSLERLLGLPPPPRRSAARPPRLGFSARWIAAMVAAMLFGALLGFLLLHLR
jgi:serine/threonine-protein kinase